MTQIGITANAQQPRDMGRLINTAKVIGSEWLSLLHGNEAHHFTSQTPVKYVIQRENNDDGANRYTPGEPGYRSPEVYMNWIERFSKDTYVLVANECIRSKHALKGGQKEFETQIRLFNEHMTACMKIAIQRGRKLAIGTPPTSTMEPEDWKLMKPTLDMVASRPDLFVFTVTGYALGGIMTSGIDGSAPLVDKLPNGTPIRPDQWYKLNPAEWPTSINVDARRWSSFRWLDMINAYLRPNESRSEAIARGVLDELPSIVEIESGVDKGDSNVTAWLDSLPQRKLTDKEAKESHVLKDTGRGWRTMREAWQSWIKTFPAPFNQLDWVDFFALQMLWYRDMTAKFRRSDGRPVMLATLPFQWTENHEWVGFDLSHEEAIRFWQFIINDAKQPSSLAVWRTATPAPPIPQPEPPPPSPPAPYPKPGNASLAIEVYALRARNLRNGPGTDYSDVGDVQRHDRIRWYTSPVIERDGLRWSWVEILDGKYAGKAGFMSVTDFQWQTNNPHPPPDPPRPTPTERVIQVVITATDEEATEIADALMRLFGSIANLGAILKPIQPRISIVDLRKDSVS